MIERVYQCASGCSAESVTVATDDQRIVDAVNAFGGNSIMTRADHPSGTDRLQEAVQILGLSDNEIVVNVQGDEPLMPAAVIEQVASNLASNSHASAATLSEDINNKTVIFNSNAVKVVTDQSDIALYFSRAPIPWHREEFEQEISGPVVNAKRHIGIYAYRVALLNKFVAWPVSELEKVEKLEQLRILANGEKIHVASACEDVPAGVDTEQDLQRVIAQLNN